jgi:hypothetical protein
MTISLHSRSFNHLEVYKVSYEFIRPNSGPVRCRDCKSQIGAGLGIHRRAYRRNGYLCFDCVSKDITILTTRYDGGDAGFFVDSLGRLRACMMSSPAISTPEVLEAIYKSLLDKSYNSIDILLGSESAHPWKVADVAEAAIGKGA